MIDAAAGVHRGAGERSGVAGGGAGGFAIGVSPMTRSLRVERRSSNSGCPDWAASRCGLA